MPKYCDDMECLTCIPGRLRDAKEAKKPKSPWRPIETAPWGTEIPFFVNARHWDTPTSIRFDRRRAAYVDERNLPVGQMDRPTHWMPIPPLPEGER